MLFNTRNVTVYVNEVAMLRSAASTVCRICVPHRTTYAQRRWIRGYAPGRETKSCTTSGPTQFVPAVVHQTKILSGLTTAVPASSTASVPPRSSACLSTISSSLLIDPGDLQELNRQHQLTQSILRRYGQILPVSILKNRPPEVDGKLMGRGLACCFIAAAAIHILPECGYSMLARDSVTFLLRGIALIVMLQCGFHSGLTGSKYGFNTGTTPFVTRRLKIRSGASSLFLLPGLLVLTFADTWVRDTCYLELILLFFLTALDYFTHKTQLAPPWYLHSMLLFRAGLAVCVCAALISEQFQLNERPIELHPNNNV